MSRQLLSRAALVASGAVRVTKEPNREYADDREPRAAGATYDYRARTALHRALLDFSAAPYWLKPVNVIVPELAVPRRERAERAPTPLGLVRRKSVAEMTPRERDRELAKQIRRLSGDVTHDDDARAVGEPIGEPCRTTCRDTLAMAV